MVRRPAFAAAWSLLLGACALDLDGLGAGDGGVDVVVVSPTVDATGADQSSVSPDGAEAGDDAADEAASSDAAGFGGETSTPQDDASEPWDAADDAPPPVGCDEDGDGYLADSEECGGTDCCDQDAHVHPGQTAYFTTPGACGGYDYNCDGKESPEYGAASCQWSSFSCSGNGFAPPVPGCGDNGTFTSCSIPWYDVFSCTSSSGQQAQGCR
ncbi:MAG: hypothetical protein ABSE49_06935 [Polyangiaceae bacterium]|jgi:hypothetical protein